MMDTSKWSDFAGKMDGAYAIGGPTIEMFALSYNAKHTTKIGTYETVNSDNANEYGYKVKVSSNSWERYSDGGLETDTDNMWVKIKNDKAGGYWIASPAASSESYVWIVERYGELNGDGESVYTTGIGFRPLIAIPKSSLK